MARMGKMRGTHRVSVGKPAGKEHLEDPGIYGRIILKWILNRMADGNWTDMARNRTHTGIL